MPNDVISKCMIRYIRTMHKKQINRSKKSLKIMGSCHLSSNLKSGLYLNVIPILFF